jgi:hypothetical protein
VFGGNNRLVKAVWIVFISDPFVDLLQDLFIEEVRLKPGRFGCYERLELSE